MNRSLSAHRASRAVIVDSLDGPSSSSSSSSSRIVDQTLRKQKKRKQLIAEAASRFNTKPRVGIAFALEAGLLEREEEMNSSLSPSGTASGIPTTGGKAMPTPMSAAKFLHRTAGLDKVLVGDYVAEPPDSHPFNTKVRECYVTLFDFRGMTFDGALRLFLSGFRLPGEAQKIDRLMEAFADRLYLAYNPEEEEEERGSSAVVGGDGSMGHPAESVGGGNDNEEGGLNDGGNDASSSSSPSAASLQEENDVGCMKSAQALFILCFSTIMLNTDLHNDGVVKKMSLDDFIRNNRGINDGENVPPDFLKRLYNNIKYNEIQLKADHLGRDGSSGKVDARQRDIDYDGLLRRQRDVADATFTPASVGRQAQLRVRAGMHERDMFELISVGAYDAIETVFNTTQSTVLRRRALEGFQHYAAVRVVFFYF